MSVQIESHIDAKTLIGGMLFIPLFGLLMFSLKYFSEESELEEFKRKLELSKGLISYEKYLTLHEEREGNPIGKGYFPKYFTKCMFNGKPSVDRWPAADGDETAKGYYKINLQNDSYLLEIRQHKGINTDWLYFTYWEREAYSYSNSGFSAVSKCKNITRELKFNKRL